MKPIAIFFHCIFAIGNPPQILPGAINIIVEQMELVEKSGLLANTSHFLVGVNGGKESELPAKLILPFEATVVYHGLQSKSENRTLVELEKWLPGHRDWNVLYFHSKGATITIDDDYRTRWRNCMMRNLVANWRHCVSALEQGYDSVGCHWLTWTKFPQMPPNQSIWAGNFWWAKASFLSLLPSLMNSPRVRQSGIDSSDSRYESEVWIGNGPTLPKVLDLHPEWPT